MWVQDSTAIVVSDSNLVDGDALLVVGIVGNFAELVALTFHFVVVDAFHIFQRVHHMFSRILDQRFLFTKLYFLKGCQVSFMIISYICMFYLNTPRFQIN